MTLTPFAIALPFFLIAPVLAAEPPKDKAARVFGPDKVWAAHLVIQPKDWADMQPTRSFFGVAARPPKDKIDPKDNPRPSAPLRGGFGFDFPYIKADFEFDGTTWTDVGVRFKGNSSYAMAGQTLKRPFKIDLNRFVPNQNLHDLKMINLANNLGEPTQVRESLAYFVFRAAGVPAPRTAFVELNLTVPAKHDREFAGLYTLIEQVDKTFLKNHFGSGAGMLLKPEGFQNLPYLGTDWQPYADMYRPKDEPDAKAKNRLIDFTRLVNFADDAAFQRDINGYLDVDRFLRYLAACSVMVNVDSFIGIGHNYFLYLNPKDNRFTFIPWDLNSTFGLFPTPGGVEAQAAWTVKKPYFAANRLTQRLLADPEKEAAFRKILGELNDTILTPEKLRAEIDLMQKAIKKLTDKEAQKKKAGLFDTLLAGKPADLKKFVADRSASITAQLAGTAEGKELTMGFFEFGQRDPLGKQVAKPLLAAADTDKDAKLSRPEVKAALTQFYAANDKGKTDSLSEKALADGLGRLLPKPFLFAFAPKDLPDYSGIHFAGLLFARSASRRVDPAGLALADLLTQADNFFAAADNNKDGFLDEPELSAALNALPPAPLVFGRPAEAKKTEGKEAKKTEGKEAKKL